MGKFVIFYAAAGVGLVIASFILRLLASVGAWEMDMNFRIKAAVITVLYFLGWGVLYHLGDWLERREHR